MNKLFKNTGIFLLCSLVACSTCLVSGTRAEAGQPSALSTVQDSKGGADNKTAPLTLDIQSEGPGEGSIEDTETLNRIVLSVGDGQKTPVYKAGTKTELKINITNKGNVDAQNVTITPVIGKTEEWPFDMEKLNYEQSLGEIRAGEQAAAVWGNGDDKLTVRKDVTGKSYKLTFKISYDDGKNVYETDKYVFVKTEAAKENSGDTGNGGNTNGGGNTNSGGANGGTSVGNGDGSESGGDRPSGGGDDMSAGVYNEDPVVSGGDIGGSGAEADNSVPRVIVTGFDTEPAQVKAGSDFKLIIHLKNTSKKTAVSNMLFDLQAPAAGTDEAAEAPAFLPVSGSSSIYLDKIPANGTKDISIELNSRADLIQKPYNITMTMQYENSDAVQFEGQSSLAIPVLQAARFEFSEIQIMPNAVMVGDEANITCNLYNLGRVKMYNVKASFEGDAITGQEQFLGNIESGGTGVIDSIVTAAAESYDESNCRLVLSYEDDSGNVTTVEQPFTMMVSPAEEIVDTGEFEMTEPEDEGSPAVGIIVAVLAGIVLVIIAVVVILKQRKRRIQLAEEEELMDEVERFTEDERREP